VLRADFDPEHSDVDVLVAFQPGREVGLIAFFQMEHELSQLFGRRVDLLTPGGLKPWVRQEILGSARVVYAAA